MTMHLVGPYLTTTNYRKRREKVTQAKLKQWEEWYKDSCKQNKRLGLPRISFDEFVDNLHGRVKYQKPTFVPLEPKVDPVLERIRQHKEMYPSAGMHQAGPNSCAKKEPMRYTGTLIKGIATMHKSNAVPVIDDEQAKEISRMRRG